MLYYISNKSYWKTAILGFLAFFFVFAIIKYSDIAFQSSLRGLMIWWEVVFPALLPFFILSEILMGLGVVHFMSVLLEPFMRPVFNVPGAGAFVMTMGFSSGYPISSKITTRLREQKLVTRAEGERLVCFTTTSDPLFMFGAIAVGFFYDSKLGILIVLSHYIAAVILGVIMRFHNRHEQNTKSVRKTRDIIFVRALKAMHQARKNDSRPFGKLLGDAVTSSMHTLALIGGFIILMSVMIAIMGSIGLVTFMAQISSYLLIAIGITPDLSPAFISGIFEVTLGSKEASITANTLLYQKIIVVSMILAWGGLSVHAQVAAILSSTDIRFLPFIYARIGHAILAAIVTIFLWSPLNHLLQSEAVPVFKYHELLSHSFNVTTYWKLMGTMCLSILSVLFIFSMIFYLAQKISVDKSY